MVRQSRLYESAPAYVLDQPQFLNGALAVRTGLAPAQLLAAVKRIEVQIPCFNISVGLHCRPKTCQKQIKLTA